jgi:chromosome segregation ATPase
MPEDPLFNAFPATTLMSNDPNLQIENINLKNDLNSVAHQNASLNQAMQVTQEQAELAWNNLRTSEEKWATTLRDMQQQQQALENLRWENSQIHAAHAATVTQLHATENENERLRSLLTGANEEINGLRHSVDTLRYENSQIEAQHARTSDQLRAAEIEIDKMRHSIDALRYDISQSENAHARTTEQLHAAESEIDRLRHLTESLRCDLSGVEAAHAATIDELRAGSIEIERMRLEQVNWQRDIQELAYHRKMLRSANEEIDRLSAVEVELASASAEVKYLRQHVDHLRDIEAKYVDLCHEADEMRHHIDRQETNFDRYAEQSRSYCLSADEEVAALKHQLQALVVAEAEVSRLRAELDVASGYFSELQYTRTQLVDARSEIEELHVELGRVNDEVKFLHAKVLQQEEKARIATAEVERIAKDNTCTVLSEQLVEAEREIIRLRNEINKRKAETENLRAKLAALHPKNFSR